MRKRRPPESDKPGWPWWDYVIPALFMALWFVMMWKVRPF